MIVGITGTLGAGKGTVVRYLEEKHNFKHFSVRAFLQEEILRRGLPDNRDTMVPLANELRAQYGPEYITRQLFERAQNEGGNAVIESIRSIGEAQYLKTHGAYLWAVDADIAVRYERIKTRASETDAITFERFVADEKREYDNPDTNKQNLAGVMAMADHLFHNDSTPEALNTQVEAYLATLK